MENLQYYYLIMSQKSLLQNQVIEEILRERANYYSTTKRNNDFWLLVSPNFIYSNNLNKKIKESNFYKKNKSLILSEEFSFNNEFEFYSSLVTTDKDFFTWISLRIGYFEQFNEIGKLQSENFVSDGIAGILKNKEIDLSSNPNYLHPSISLDRYKRSLKLYLNDQKLKLIKN